MFLLLFLYEVGWYLANAVTSYCKALFYAEWHNACILPSCKLITIKVG